MLVLFCFASADERLSTNTAHNNSEERTRLQQGITHLHSPSSDDHANTLRQIGNSMTRVRHGILLAIARESRVGARVDSVESVCDAPN